MNIELSVIIPVYNGEKTITNLVENLVKKLGEISHEIILINDGSPDNSEMVCIELSEKFKNLTFISLRKNFGEFNAVMCGLNHSVGQYVVMIDDDFQNPPSEILKLYEKAKSENLDVVYSFYSQKKHHWFRNFGSSLVNQLTTSLFGKPKDLYLSSFKLIKSEVVSEIIKYTGPYPYIDALIFRVTDNVGKVQVQHNKREDGNSNYSFKKLHALFMTIVFGYSILPARIVLNSGIILLVFSILLIILYFLKVFQNWEISIFLLFGGIQLISIGIVGEYLSKSFLTQNAHPQFVIKFKK